MGKGYLATVLIITKVQPVRLRHWAAFVDDPTLYVL